MGAPQGRGSALSEGGNETLECHLMRHVKKKQEQKEGIEPTIEPANSTEGTYGTNQKWR